MDSGVQTGASFQLLIFFNNISIPSSIVIVGCQLSCSLILDISAKDLSVSPGLFGTIVLFPPMDRVYEGVVQEFKGWNFITGLESRYQINLTYLLIELFLATILFFLFRNKIK